MSTIIAIVLVFSGLILVHELGHFLVAKRAGVQVDEFALGFGPRLAVLRRGETDYTLRLVPLGGFVRMAGMYPNERDGSGEAERSREANASGRGWAAKGLWPRVAIIAAGPLMNFLVAVVLVAAVFGAVGVPNRPTLVVAEVEAGYPAQTAGIRPGDRILAIDSQPITSWDQLHRVVAGSAGRQLAIQVQRGEQRLVLHAAPVAAPDGSGGLVGIRPVIEVTRLGAASALWHGMAWTWEIVGGWFAGLLALIQGAGGGQVLGPVGIGEQIGLAAQSGLASLLLFVAALSANLGLINLLPIPALDGSRLLFLGLEGVRGRPVDPEKEGFVHLVGFALIIVLTVVVTYHDLARLNLG